MLVRDRAEERALTGRELAEFGRTLERDPALRGSFDADPVAAAEVAGWPELARSLERELRELIALAEQITADAAYREALQAHPVSMLEVANVPAGAAEPLLRALAVPDEVLATLPEVVAHQHEHESTRTQLLILLLNSAAVEASLRKFVRRP